MTRPFLDLSEKLDKSTSLFWKGYQVVSEISESLGISFFVVGATARDLVLEHGYKIKPYQGTKDVDFAVQVSNWEQFNRLTMKLVEKGGFQDSKEVQRFYYNGTAIDIIPFGEIGSGNTSIKWPPTNEVVMDILGFDEAYDNALLVRLAAKPVFEMKVVAPSGWALLKIIAWKDRDAGARIKDAKDLALILRNYTVAGNLERLYVEPHVQMFEEEDYELELAGARLLGRDIAKIAKRKSLDKARQILEDGTSEDLGFPLVIDMAMSKIDQAAESEKNLLLLSKLKKGLEESV
jgi:predicted nucleotidyltransferase